MTSTAGARPTRNIARQALPIAPDSSSLPSTMLMTAASMLPDRRERLEPAQRERPGAVRHDLGHQRDADRELAADAQAGQEPVEREVPDSRREGAQAR